jgi:hypothetical protein
MAEKMHASVLGKGRDGGGRYGRKMLVNSRGGGP